MATQCRGTKTKRINRHKLAVIQAYIIIGTLVLIGFIGGASSTSHSTGTTGIA